MPIPERPLRTLTRILLAAFSIGIHTNVHAQPSGFDIAQLMQLLSKIESHEAVFTEKKQLALLTDPLISKGTLRYRRPNYIERSSTAPRIERFIYENDKIIIETNGQQRSLQANTQPTVGALIESMRATLAGDEASLRRHYQLRLTGASANWTLELTPVHASLAKRIREHRPHDLPRLLEQSARHPQLIVIGSRLHDKRGIPRARYLANRFANFWIAWAAGYPLVDSQSGFRIYPAALLLDLPKHMQSLKGFVFESEILIQAGEHGVYSRAVPIPAIYSSARRKSYFHPLYDTAQIAWMVAKRLFARRMYLHGLCASLSRRR